MEDFAPEEPSVVADFVKIDQEHSAAPAPARKFRSADSAANSKMKKKTVVACPEQNRTAAASPALGLPGRGSARVRVLQLPTWA